MDKLETRKRGKVRRVSPRRELAAVSLAAVASISGVGGLLAAGQHTGAPTQPAGVSTAKDASAHKPLALAPTSFKGRGEEDGDDGGTVFHAANRATRPVRRKANVSRTPAQPAHHSTVSRGSAPVN